MDYLQNLVAKYGLQTTAAFEDTEIAQAIHGSLFPAQQALVDDTARHKAAICPRRAGKSWAAMSYGHIVCLNKPGASVVVIGLTLKSLKNIYWQGLIPRFHRTFGIKAKLHHTDMRIRFDNGSVLTFVGAETKAEIEKLRGGSYDLVIFDECKSFGAGILQELLVDVIEPACMDRGGTICMIGTPGNILAGLFFEATYPGYKRDGAELPVSRTFSSPEPRWKGLSPEEAEWSRHAWTLLDNTTVPGLVKDARRIKKRSGWDDDHPTWLREYMGQWVPSESAFVYAFATLAQEKPDKVYWQPDFKDGNQFGLPQGHDWRYILGIDLGFEDDFAAVVGAYSIESGQLFQVWEYKGQHHDVYEAAAKIEEAVALFGKFDAMVADAVGLGKMVVETLNKRHGFYIQPAEKREKNDHVELLNGDFHAGKCKLLRGSDLAAEMLGLQWDLTKGSKEELVRAGKLKELHSCPNHLSDAWLYLWRFSHHFWGAASISHSPRLGTAQWFAEWAEKSEARLSERSPDGNSLLSQRIANSRDPLQEYGAQLAYARGSRYGTYRS